MYPEQNLSRIPNPVSKVAESKISKSYSPKHKYTPSLIELVVGTLKRGVTLLPCCQAVGTLLRTLSLTVILLPTL